MTARLGDWMQLYSGGAFWPLDPRPEDVTPIDIAHALSHLCRFGGHVKRFYCPTPDQRVLTADLRWTPAGDLRVGDELVGFDETPHELGQAGNRRRRFRPSRVLTAMPVKRQIVRLEMADGSEVRTSAEHPWLVATKNSRNQTWMTAADIARDVTDGRLRYMHKFAEPWATDDTRDGGWLAGIFDGEGHVSLGRAGGVQTGVAQLPGLVLDDIVAGMTARGFDYRLTKTGATTSNVHTLQLRGGWRELMRLLGTLRPVRLLDKFTTAMKSGAFDKQLNGIGEPLRIVRGVVEGEEWVAGLETSTRTYLCEGFGAHNSVAEHCVLMSYAVPRDIALWALLHDASEAYVVDLPRPIKRHMPDYVAAERRVMDAIVTRFAIDAFEPPGVKAADTRIVLDERAALLGPPPLPWGWTDAVKPLGVTITGWRPEVARSNYLARLSELGAL